VAIVLTLAIVMPLAAESYSVAVTNLSEQRAAQAARVWLAGSGYRFVSVTASDDVNLVVAGQGELPAVDKLKADVRGRLFGKSVKLDVVPEQTTTFGTR
jgi:hypothetical protein